jgi:tetratricopeptide (TPR) repeat protein
MGRYDESLNDYLAALELRRTSGDRRGVAIESYSIGTIFDYQGRYGAAVKSKQEALATFRELKQREMWLAEILSGYGNSLSLSGRTDDAARSLDEAMTIAREIQNPSQIAQATLFESNRFYYSGDSKAAVRLAEQASEAAAKASDRALGLSARAAVAITSSSTQPSRALAAQLSTIAQEADAQGLQYLSLQCSLQRAETLLKLGDRSAARQEVDRSLAKAEAFGFRLLLAKARYLRASLLRLGGDADSPREYAAALRVLEEMKGEEGNQDVLKRADLNAMHEDCVKYSKAA